MPNTLFFLLVIAVPIFLEIEILLKLWLKNVPAYTKVFCQLVLISTLIHCLDISIVLSARGEIKENQLYGGLVYLMILPGSYISLKSGLPPETVFIIQIIGTIIVDLGINLYLLKKIADIPLSLYFKQLIFPILKVTVLSLPLPILITSKMQSGLFRLIIMTLLSTFSILIIVYLVGVSEMTRQFIKQKVKNLKMKK